MGEALRVADFINWLTQETERCDVQVEKIEGLLNGYSERKCLDQQEVNKFIQVIRVTDAPTSGDHYVQGIDENRDRIATAMSRAEEALNKGSAVPGYVRKWRVYGFGDRAAGGLYYHKIWTALQTAPLWGYMPLQPPEDRRILSYQYEWGGGVPMMLPVML